MEITVIGTGRAALAPERATIHLTAGFEGADKAQVVRRTTDLVNALSAELTRLREHESRPTTWSAVLPIGTRSWRPWSDKGTVLPMRYAASSRVQVKFRDFRALSGFADAWGGLEGVTLGHVEWTLTEATRKETDERVRAEAVVDARERAQVYATAAGGGVVRCVQIADPGLLILPALETGKPRELPPGQTETLNFVVLGDLRPEYRFDLKLSSLPARTVLVRIPDMTVAQAQRDAQQASFAQKVLNYISAPQQVERFKILSEEQTRAEIAGFAKSTFAERIPGLPEGGQ